MSNMRVNKISFCDIVLSFITLFEFSILISQWIFPDKNTGLVLFVLNYIIIFLIIFSIYCKGFTKHFLLFSFYICFFIFLMGQKPFMMPWKENYNTYLTFSKTVLNADEYTTFATLLFLSLSITYYSYFFFFNKKHSIILMRRRASSNLVSPKKLLPVIRLGFIITFFCALIMQLQIVIIKGAMLYTASYLINIDIPIILKIGNYLFPFFSLIYLSLHASKRQTYIVLFLYIFVEGGLQLLQHRRALFATSVLFTVWFLFQYNKVEKVNFNLLLKMFGLLVGFIGLFYIVEAIRTVGGMQGNNHSILSIIKNLLISTGGSDSVIANTIHRSDKFLKPGYVYLFGPLLDNPLGSLLKAIIAGAPFASYGQGLDYLSHNNDFAHWISYITEESLYLSGHGMGSSYIAEIYLAFGVLGVALFAVILAWLINAIQHINLEKGHIFKNVLIMFFVQEIFTLPRNGVFSWFGNFLYLLFGMLLIYLFYYKYISLNKYYILKRGV